VKFLSLFYIFQAAVAGARHPKGGAMGHGRAVALPPASALTPHPMNGLLRRLATGQPISRRGHSQG